MRVVCAESAEGALCVLAKYLSSEPGFGVVRVPGPAETVGLESVRLAPCVWLVDERTFLGLDSAWVGSLVGFGQRVQALVVGSEDRELPRVRELLQRGCAGIIDERARPQMVRKAVRAVAEGEFWIPRRVLADVLRDLARRCSHSSLTDREREILWLISQGLTNRAIAEKLSITRETVRWHIRSLYSKIGVRDRLSAVYAARDFFDGSGAGEPSG